MRFFSVDNPVWRFVRKIGYLWILNILWVATSLPVITIGASTTALIYACMKLQDDEGYPTANYFRSFRENFRQATAIWLIYLVVGALLIYGLIFWNLMDGTSLRIGHAFAIAILIPYGLSLLYVFAIQAKFVNRVPDTIHFALVLPIKHFGWTLQMVILVGAVVYLNVTTIVWTNFITLTVGIGWMAYLLSLYYMRVFERYIPKTYEPEEPAQFDWGDTRQETAAGETRQETAAERQPGRNHSASRKEQSGQILSQNESRMDESVSTAGPASGRVQ